MHDCRGLPDRYWLHSYDDWTSDLKNVPRSFEADWDPVAAAKFYFFAQVWSVHLFCNRSHHAWPKNYLLTRTWNTANTVAVAHKHYVLALQAGERVATTGIAQLAAHVSKE
jgi:hypothetical protein